MSQAAANLSLALTEDLALMARAGVNTLRLYTPPSCDLLDEIARQGLRALVGIPRSQHVAFLDVRHLCRSIRRSVVDTFARSRTILLFCSSRWGMKFHRVLSGGTDGNASSVFSATFMMKPRLSHPTACLHTSTIRPRKISTSHFSTCVPSTSTCI
jgi:hypothetical protein